MSSTGDLCGHHSIAGDSIAIDPVTDDVLPGSDNPIAPAVTATDTNASDTSNEVPIEKTMVRTWMCLPTLHHRCILLTRPSLKWSPDISITGRLPNHEAASRDLPNDRQVRRHTIR